MARDPKFTIVAEDRTKQAFDSVQHRLDKTGRTAARMATAVTAALSTAAIGAFTKHVIDNADELGKLASQLGVTVEDLSTLVFAAEQSGAGLDDLRLALRRLARGIDEGIKGAGTYGKQLKMLGIEVKDNEGKARGTMDVLRDMADLFATMPDGAEKTAIAYQVLGDNGQRLIPLLNEGAAGMSALQDQARDLGLEIDQNTAKRAAEFNDRLAEVKKSAVGAGQGILFDMLPSLGRISTAMSEAAREGGVLTAIWVGMGGAAKEAFDGIFGETTEQELESVRTELQRLREEQAEFEKLGAAGTSAAHYKARSNRIAELVMQEIELENTVSRRAKHEEQRAEQERRAEEERKAREQETLARLEREREQIAENARLEQERAALQKSQDTAVTNLARQAATIGEVTELERTLWEIENGRYKDFDDNAKQRLMWLARDIDEHRELTAAAKEAADARRREQEEQARQAETAKEYVTALEHEVKMLRASERDKFIDAQIRRLGANATQEQIDKVRQLSAALYDQQERAERTSRAAEDLGHSFSSAFENAVISGGSLRSMLAGIAEDIARIALRESITRPLGAKVGSFFSGLFGFAAGGSFRVGGSGGTDSQLVAFKATPDETVSITKPGQSMGGGGITVHSTTNIDARGADPGMLARLGQVLDARDEALEERLMTAVARSR